MKFAQKTVAVSKKTVAVAKKTAVLLSVVGASTVAASAHAADDLGVVAITALQATATAYIAAAFGCAVLVAAGFWGIAMMKKSFGAAK